MRVKVICIMVLVVAFMLAIAVSSAVALNNLVCSTCTTWDTSAPFTVDAPAGSVVSEVWIEVAEPSTPTADLVPAAPAPVSPCRGPFTSDGVVEEGCYEIVGIGTGSVTVTVVGDCFDIAHIEVCFTPVETATLQADAYPTAAPLRTLPSTGLVLALPVFGFGLAGAGAFFLKRRRG